MKYLIIRQDFDLNYPDSVTKMREYTVAELSTLTRAYKDLVKYKRKYGNFWKNFYIKEVEE